MRRLLILFSAVPILASVVLAHVMGWRVLNKRINLSLRLRDILEKLQVAGICYVAKKRVWAAIPISKKGEPYIIEKHLDSRDSQIVSQELLRIGIAEINKHHPSMVQWRIKLIKAGYFLPPFIILGGALAMIGKGFPSSWFIVLFLATLASCSIILWISRSVEKEAAAAISQLLERKRVLCRLSEEEVLIESIYAWTWVGLLPGMLISLSSKMNQRKKYSE